MAKTIFEEMGGTYTQVGDYLLPDLELPEEEQQPIGVWGQRHRRYLKEHRGDNLCDTTHQRKTEQLPCRHRPPVGGDVLSAGKADGRGGRRHGEAQGWQSNGVGRQDE